MGSKGFVTDTPPRPLTKWEQRVVTALAPGHDADALVVHSHCQCGCASISFVPQLRAHSLLAEAAALDTDGVPFWFLLFGSDDRTELDELEIQRADGAPLREAPDPDALRTETR